MKTVDEYCQNAQYCDTNLQYPKRKQYLTNKVILLTIFVDFQPIFQTPSGTRP
jgi:hypothetical protein